MNHLKKIAVVGISASGKSICSRALSKLTGLPVLHMDSLFWRGAWEAVPEDLYLEEHAKLLNQERWIIEGYIDNAMAKRAELADLIIYLDYSGHLVAWRYIKRWFKYRIQSRPELPKEARERLQVSTLWLLLTRGERKDIEAALKGVSISKIERFKNPKDLSRYIQKSFY